MKMNRNIILRWLLNFTSETVDRLIWFGRTLPLSASLLYLSLLTYAVLCILGLKIEAFRYSPPNTAPFPRQPAYASVLAVKGLRCAPMNAQKPRALDRSGRPQ